MDDLPRGKPKIDDDLIPQCEYAKWHGGTECDFSDEDPCDPCAARLYRELLATAAGRIWAERERQIEDEGYSAAHDDQYQKAELARAGYLYARAAADQIRENKFNLTQAPLDWPWDARFWRPDLDNPVRTLAKAGALIAAEMDRLMREHREDDDAEG